MFESFLGGFAILFNPETVLMTFLLMAAGLFLGMFVGALPGFTTLMAMAILLPISFFIHPLLGIPFLIGVYKGGIYGGSIPAILVSMPGTGAAVATTFDGPPLTKKGQARKALEMALFASVSGDLTSDMVTIVLIGPIAVVALLLGPPELAAILFLGAFGYIAKKLQFDVTPMAMGFILGPTLEYSFGQTVILSTGDLLGYVFIERPFTAAIIALTPVLTFVMWRRSAKLRGQFVTEQ